MTSTRTGFSEDVLATMLEFPTGDRMSRFPTSSSSASYNSAEVSAAPSTTGPAVERDEASQADNIEGRCAQGPQRDMGRRKLAVPQSAAAGARRIPALLLHASRSLSVAV